MNEKEIEDLYIKAHTNKIIITGIEPISDPQDPFKIIGQEEIVEYITPLRRKILKELGY